MKNKSSIFALLICMCICLTACGNNKKIITTEEGYKFDKDMPTISIPKEAKNVTIEDDKITYSLIWDWGEISYLYEIDSSITNIGDCERKVNVLMEEIDNNADTSRYITNRGVGYSCIIGKNAVKNKELEYTFDDMFVEEYLCFDSKTIHYKCSVERWNYIDLYNSYETDVEKYVLSNTYDNTYIYSGMNAYVLRTFNKHYYHYVDKYWKKN